MTSFTPTLTLSHPLAGWDGTFGQMVDAMAGVLDDGPVEASVTYWDRRRQRFVTCTGEWESRDAFDMSVIFKTKAKKRLRIEEDDIKELSI